MTAAAQYRAGSGEPLVLLHGFTGTWRIWEPILPALEQRHEVLAVTLLGHFEGDDFPPGTPASFVALADGVERDLDAAGFDTAHVVGNSLGGWLALEPDEARLQRYFARTHRALRLIAPRADRLVRRPRLRALMLRDLCAHPEKLSPAAAFHTIRGAAECSAYLPLLEAIRRDGPPADLSGITVPTRIVWGTRDRIIPGDRYSARLRRLVPEAEYVELPGLGHVPMSDDPELVARAILEVTAAGAHAGAAV